ncbi:hypothetical protein [Agrobacterium sp.]|uniref:hypothetical protein n=1 Tax=Agrobacterium sp. TaxID=361 RepID=UPI0028A7B20B|nr:hypothetical protein [Agrobacterium sp.]
MVSAATRKRRLASYIGAGIVPPDQGGEVTPPEYPTFPLGVKVISAGDSTKGRGFSGASPGSAQAYSNNVSGLMLMHALHPVFLANEFPWDTSTDPSPPPPATQGNLRWTRGISMAVSGSGINVHEALMPLIVSMFGEDPGIFYYRPTVNSVGGNPTVIAATIARIIALLDIARNAGEYIVLATMPPWAAGSPTWDSAENRANRITINQAMADYAAMHGQSKVMFVNLDNVFLAPDGIYMKSGFLNDDVHFRTTAALAEADYLWSEAFSKLIPVADDQWSAESRPNIHTNPTFIGTGGSVATGVTTPAADGDLPSGASYAVPASWRWRGNTGQTSSGKAFVRPHPAGGGRQITGLIVVPAGVGTTEKYELLIGGTGAVAVASAPGQFVETWFDVTIPVGAEFCTPPAIIQADGTGGTGGWNIRALNWDSAYTNISGNTTGRRWRVKSSPLLMGAGSTGFKSILQVWVDQEAALAAGVKPIIEVSEMRSTIVSDPRTAYNL